MSNYTQSTNFATKDALPSGDPLKIVKGTEINTEFNNISVAIATKADLASPTLTSPTLVTPALGTPSSGNLVNCTFPTLNQNTTGNAATATNPQSGGSFITSSNIASQSVAFATNATNATTAANGGVTSVNGSTGAVTVSVPTFTATDAVGSVMVLAYSADYLTLSNGRKPGDSISGSSLFRCTAGNGGQFFAGSSSAYSLGGIGNVFLVAASGFPVDLRNRTTAFNAQQTPSGTATWTPCSGTWRVLNNALGAYFNGYQDNIYPSMLCIRIA